MDDLTAVPQQFTAGETVAWTISDVEYPATTWTLTTVLINAAGKTTVTGVASGSDHVNTIAASASAVLVAGVYSWQSKMTAGTVVYLYGAGTIEILPNFAATGLTTFDNRSHVKTVLDAIEAVIEGRATQDHLSMSVAGRSIQKLTIAELIPVRDRYRAEYQRELDGEKIARGEATGRNKLVRFR